MTIYIEYPKGILLFAIALACALGLSVLLSFNAWNANPPGLGTAPSQNQVFRVNVQFNNSSSTDEVGTIHVFADNTNTSKVSNDAFFPTKSTVYQLTG